MMIIGGSLLGKMKFNKYKTQKSCEKALENMIKSKNINNNDKCPAWDGIECRNGIYNKSSGKCSTTTKSNIGSFLIILGCFILLPLSIIIIIIMFTQHKSMTPSLSPSLSPGMSAGMTPYYY